jgi:hypothetical protein
MKHWAYNPICPQRIIHKQMASQKEQIRDWKYSFDATVTRNRTTGISGYQWQSSLITNGQMPQPRKPRSILSWDTPPEPNVLRLVGRSVRRARGGVILKSTTTKGGLL